MTTTAAAAAPAAMTPPDSEAEAATARTAREADGSRPSSAFDSAGSRARSGSVTFASPRSLALPMPLSPFSSSPFSASLSSSSAASLRSHSASPSASDAARSSYEMRLAIQRREFEQRFAVYQKRVSADAMNNENVELREQLTLLKQQIAVQEMFLACQRTELANFYHHKQPAIETTSSAETAEEAVKEEKVKRQQQQEEQQTAAVQQMEVVVQPVDATLQPLPSPPASPSSVSSTSSVSSAASGAATTGGSSSRTPVVAQSRPVSSPAPSTPSLAPSTPSLSGLFDAVIKSELGSRPISRLGTAVTAARSPPVAQLSASPFADLLFDSSPSVPHLSIESPSNAAAAKPADSELAELLALTDTQLSQAEDELLLERAVSERLHARVNELERRVEELQAGFVLDAREMKAQLELRVQVCSRQEEALHRLTFENRSLIQQLMDIQQQQQSPPSPSPSSHHLPPASSLPQPASSRYAANAGKEMIAMTKLAAATAAASSARPSRSRFISPPSPASAASSALHAAALGLSQDWKPYGASLATSAAALPSVSASGRVGAQKERRRDEEWKEQLSSAAVPPLSLPTIHLTMPVTTEQQTACDGEVIVSSSPRSPVTAFPPLLPAAVAAGALPVSAPSPSSALSSSPLPAPVSSSPASVRLISQTFEPPPRQPSPQQLHLHDAFHRPPPPHVPFTSSYLQRQAAAAATATEETKEQETVSEQPALEGFRLDVVSLGATSGSAGGGWPSGTEREAEDAQLRSSPAADDSRYLSEKGPSDSRGGDGRLAV